MQFLQNDWTYAEKGNAFKPLFKDANASLVKCRYCCQKGFNEIKLNLVTQNLILDLKKVDGHPRVGT